MSLTRALSMTARTICNHRGTHCLATSDATLPFHLRFVLLKHRHFRIHYEHISNPISLLPNNVNSLLVLPRLQLLVLASTL